MNIFNNFKRKVLSVVSASLIALVGLSGFSAVAFADTVSVSYGRASSVVGTYAQAADTLATFTPANPLTEGDNISLYFSNDITINSGNLVASDFTIQQQGGSATAASGISYIASINSGTFAGYHRIRLTTAAGSLSGDGLGQIVIKMSGTASGNEIKNPNLTSTQSTFGLSTADDTGTQVEVTYTYASLASITVSPDGSSLDAGSTLGFTAEGFDTYGNSRGDVTESTTFTVVSGGGYFDGVTYHATSTGSVTVRGDKGDYNDTATLTVDHGATTGITISPSSPSIDVGGSQSFSITAHDSNGNTWSVDADSYTVDNGNCSVDGSSVSGISSPGCTVTAHYGDFTNDASLTVNVIDEGPGPATHLVVSGVTNPITAGVSSDVTVTAKDDSDRTATGYRGTIHFTLSGSHDDDQRLPRNYTFVEGDNGSHTFSGGVTFKRSGTFTLTATDRTTPSINGAQTGIEVDPASASRLDFTVEPAGRTRTNATISPAVQVSVKDVFGNVVTGATNTIHLALTSSHGGGTLSGTATNDASSGVATFNNLSINRTGDYHLMATSGGLRADISREFDITR